MVTSSAAVYRLKMNQNNGTAAVQLTGSDDMSSIQIVALFSNIAALIINIVHTIIVWQLKSLKNTAHKTTLLSLTFSDILFCFTRCVYYFPEFPYRMGIKPDGVEVNVPLPVIIALDYPTNLYCWIFLMTAVVQFMAIYYPLRFQYHPFIAHLKKIMVSTFVLSFAITVVEFHSINLLAMTGQEFTSETIHGKIVTESLPSMVAIVILTAVIIKLVKRHNQKASKKLEKARKAAIYVASVFIIFILTMILEVLLFYAMTVTQNIVYYDVKDIVMAFYAVINSALYMFLSKDYTDLTLRIFYPCCKTKKLRLRSRSRIHCITVRPDEALSTI